MVVVWNKKAEAELEEVYYYIQMDSPQMHKW